MTEKSRKYKTILFFFIIEIVLLLMIIQLLLMTYNNRVYTILCGIISSSEYKLTGKINDDGIWEEKKAEITFNRKINGFTLKKVLTRLEEKKIIIYYMYIDSDDVEYTTYKIKAFDVFDERGIILKEGGRVSGIDFYSWEYEPKEIIDIESSHDLEDKISSFRKYNVALYVSSGKKIIIIYDDNFDLFKGNDE